MNSNLNVKQAISVHLLPHYRTITNLAPTANIYIMRGERCYYCYLKTILKHSETILAFLTNQLPSKV